MQISFLLHNLNDILFMFQFQESLSTLYKFTLLTKPLIFIHSLRRRAKKFCITIHWNVPRANKVCRIVSRKKKDFWTDLCNRSLCIHYTAQFRAWDGDGENAKKSHSLLYSIAYELLQKEAPNIYRIITSSMWSLISLWVSAQTKLS